MMLSEPFLRRLDALRLTLADAARGASGGARRSKKLGTSAEFSDFREYAPGDDIRRIDWNAYARFDRLFLKLFTEERETTLTVLLDDSLSMGMDGKWEAAIKAAEALIYLALSGGDRARVVALSAMRESPVFSGRAAFPRAAAFLAGVRPAGAVGLNRSLPRAQFPAGRGLCAIVSDFLSEDGFDRGVASLAFRGQSPMAVQVLSGRELRPDYEGALKLIDAEDGREVKIQAGAAAFSAYDRALRAFLEEVARVAARYAAPNALLDASEDFEQAALAALMRAGIAGS
ncbi:MAG: DUF58 domain-containing protein [Clostridiales bacterium]|nr:DUF58 domain-containing protein [Clostridiales bacterium]